MASGQNEPWYEWKDEFSFVANNKFKLYVTKEPLYSARNSFCFMSI